MSASDAGRSILRNYPTTKEASNGNTGFGSGTNAGQRGLTRWRIALQKYSKPGCLHWQNME
jgi:hypothetical protein